MTTKTLLPTYEHKQVSRDLQGKPQFLWPVYSGGCTPSPPRRPASMVGGIAGHLRVISEWHTKAKPPCTTAASRCLALPQTFAEEGGVAWECPCLPRGMLKSCRENAQRTRSPTTPRRLPALLARTELSKRPLAQSS